MSLPVQRSEYNLLIDCGRFLTEHPASGIPRQGGTLMAREEAFELERPEAATNVQSIEQ
jgi:hypothetical protein